VPHKTLEKVNSLARIIKAYAITSRLMKLQTTKENNLIPPIHTDLWRIDIAKET